MKLRNKLIATIVSISMVLAVIGVGAWASTESFTATITNTVNLEFDNIKGQIAVEAMFGADDVSDGTLLQNVLYDGSNVIYNQISSAATSGTNLYWEGTQFLDGSDDGLGLVDASTEAAAILYAFMYQPTEDCVGTSTITAMVNEANAPEISGGKLMVKYFATTDLETLTEIASGEAITPINDNEFLVIMAVCQFYNLDGESISTTASAWDFSVTFSAGSNELTTLPGGAIIDDPDPSDGVVLPFDYKSGRGTPRIRNTANLEFQNLDGQVFVEGMSGADNVSSDQTPHLQEELYTENQAVYTQISPDATSGTNLNWN